MAPHSRAVAWAACFFLAGCSSGTIIRSDPSGATVYIDGSKAGTTPYYHSDIKMVGDRTSVKLEKEGYEEFETSFTRSEEFQLPQFIGGLFFPISLMWVMGYHPERTYTLSPRTETPPREQQAPQPASKVSTGG
jgi:hypothetical protein